MVYQENNNTTTLKSIIIEDELKAQRILQTLIEENCEGISVYKLVDK